MATKISYHKVSPNSLSMRLSQNLQLLTVPFLCQEAIGLSHLFSIFLILLLLLFIYLFHCNVYSMAFVGVLHSLFLIFFFFFFCKKKILKTHEINAETRPGPIGLTDHPETQRFRYQTHHLSSIKAKAKKKNNSQH
jgi:Ca2+/Na+ antiporter